MASGIWPSVSGASARAQSIEIVANNLANIDTNGFKKDTPTFKEYLATLEREHPSIDIPRGPIKDKDFYPLDGKDQSFVVTNGTYTNFKPGNLKVTQAPLDIALDGPGFFEVSTPSGIRYTKQGSFKLAKDGQLVTKEGYPVLSSQPAGLATAQLAATAVQPSQGGPTTQGGVAAGQGPNADTVARMINLRDYGPNFTVSEAGEIFAGEQPVAKLAVREFADTAKLRKSGNLLFDNPDPKNVSPSAGGTIVRQGMVETSNVNPIEEMTQLIKANRLYEHDLKSMRTYGEIMSKEANDIGKI